MGGESQPRRRSSVIYDRLLRGEATSKEYVDQLKMEIALNVRETMAKHRKGRPIALPIGRLP